MDTLKDAFNGSLFPEPVSPRLPIRQVHAREKTVGLLANFRTRREYSAFFYFLQAPRSSRGKWKTGSRPRDMPFAQL